METNNNFAFTKIKYIFLFLFFSLTTSILLIIMRTNRDNNENMVISKYNFVYESFTLRTD